MSENKTISRQRKWQLKMVAQGRCPHCGKAGGRCKTVKLKDKNRYKKWRIKIKEEIREIRAKWKSVNTRSKI